MKNIYNNKINNEIRNVVNNFNRKITRLNKKNKNIGISKIKIKDLKKYDNRRELRRELNRLKRFGSRGSEEIIQLKSGLKLTKWELNELKIEKSRAYRQINKGLKELETKKVKVLGKVQDVTFATMGSQEYLNLEAKKKIIKNKSIQNLDRREYERFISLLENVNKIESDDNLKDTFIEIFKNTSYMVNFDPQKTEAIIKKMEGVKRFKDMIEEDKGLKSIFNYYNLLKIPTFRKENIDEDLYSIFDSVFDNIDVIVNEYK